MPEPPAGARAYIKASALDGNGMFASENIQAGDSIFETRPLVSALDVPRLQDTCASCFTPASDTQHGLDGGGESLTLRTCTGCKTNRYCSKQCQTESWKRQHHYECKLIRLFPSTGQLPNAVRAVLQMLRSATDWQTSPYKQMAVHLDEIIKQGGDRYENILTLSTGIYHYTQARVPVELLHLCFAMCFTNSLSLYTPTYDPLGVAVDPFVSAANHSCEPNAISVWDGSVLSFRSLRPIRKDEEIFITYIDSSDPVGRRRHELRERYFFTCRCSKCKNDEATNDEGFLSRPSLSSNEKFSALLEDKLTKAKSCFRRAVAADFEPWTLQNEGHVLGGGEEEFEALTNIQKLGFAASTAVKNTTSPIEFLDVVLSTCIDTGIWPQHRQPVPLLRQEKFVLLLQQQRFIDAFRVGAMLCFNSWPVMYPQAHHPQLVVYHWTLAKLCLYLAGDQEKAEVKELQSRYGFGFDIIGVRLLLDIDGRVDMSHGKKSRFAKVVRDKMAEVGVNEGLKQAGESVGMQMQVEEQWKGVRRFAGDSLAVTTA